MATTGTYAFSQSAASGLTLIAFGRIGIRRTELTTQHLADAASEANLLQVAIGNEQPNLWRSEIYDIELEPGESTYDLPPRMIAVQDIYMTTLPLLANVNTATDRLLWPMSLYEYDAQPNKIQQAPPTAYVVNKLIPTPTIVFWQVPDEAATYTVHVRMLSQIQDASQIGATNLDLPYTYLDVYVAGLAHRLARIYAPDKEQMRRQDYLDALVAAQKTDTQDNVGLYIQPALGGYYR